jgi:hypothetical protein
VRQSCVLQHTFRLAKIMILTGFLSLPRAAYRRCNVVADHQVARPGCDVSAPFVAFAITIHGATFHRARSTLGRIFLRASSYIPAGVVRAHPSGGAGLYAYASGPLEGGTQNWWSAGSRIWCHQCRMRAIIIGKYPFNLATFNRVFRDRVCASFAAKGSHGNQP